MREGNPSEPEYSDLSPEIARLRARVQELEDEISRRSPRHREREFAEEPEEPEASDVRDVPGRAVDEMSKLVRGFVLAAVEPIRIAGQLASHFGDEVRSRNRPDRAETRSGRRSERTPRGLVSDLPRDVTAGLNRALDESFSIPGRVVDRFHEAYKETESVQQSRAERELRRAEESLARAERLAKTQREERTEPRRRPETDPPLIE